MKILTGTQIALADKQTIELEAIESIELMERASEKIADYISQNIDTTKTLCFIIGKGNNGGDGLAVARILSHRSYKCKIFIPEYEGTPSADMTRNLNKLTVSVDKITSISEIQSEDIIIDALLGSGTKGKAREYYETIINQINEQNNFVISIDLPSGMNSDFNQFNDCIIQADITLTIQFPKLAMMFPFVGNFCGQLVIIDINLDTRNIISKYSYTTLETLKPLFKKPKKFDYKNVYGHTLLICGCKEMMGAAILSTQGALRSGCGLVTSHIPYDQRQSMQISAPSAMISINKEDYFSQLPENLEKYNSIVIGPGLGKNRKTRKAFEKLLKSTSAPMLIDADAINIIAENHELLDYIPQGSILTPHLGELKRLITWDTTEQMLQKIADLAAKIKSYFIIKSAYTAIVSPNGNIAFNSTGCVGMAKGGCGDILSGFIGGLLARGYNSYEAAIIGVYYHGKAGNKASEKYGLASMNSSDLIDYLILD